jgi:hypothetical protein
MWYKEKIGKRKDWICSHCAVQLLLAEHSIGRPKWGSENLFGSLIVGGVVFLEF